MEIVVLGVSNIGKDTYHMFDMWLEDFEFIQHAIRGEEGMKGIFYGDIDLPPEDIVNMIYSSLEEYEEIDPDVFLLIVPKEKREKIVNLLTSFGHAYGKNWQIRKKSGSYEMNFSGITNTEGVTKIRLNEDSFAENVLHPVALKNLEKGRDKSRLQ
jgi:coproporphyrinogen III oxidase